MTYLLDTNVCIQFLRGKNATVLHNFAIHPAVEIALCSVVVAELLYGAERSSNPAKERRLVEAFAGRFRVLPYDDAAARLYVSHRVDLETRGIMIGHFDLMIAAIGLANA